MGEPRRASATDPFMSSGSYKHYKPLHSLPVRPLGTIIKQLKNKSRIVNQPEIVDDIKVLDERFLHGRAPTPSDCEVEVIRSARPKVKVDPRDKTVSADCNR